MRSALSCLAEDAGENRKGFLLNHVISELLPPEGDGLRYANADPVTGQAAWYDLRVRVEKAAVPLDRTEPSFAAIPKPPGMPEAPAMNRFGGLFRRRRAGR